MFRESCKERTVDYVQATYGTARDSGAGPSGRSERGRRRVGAAEKAEHPRHLG